ncbi:phosphoadenosine phosphosulfate reductase family protein [Bordetella hinzii]|uniref:phosphoadenosine phosphosulfate reductase domain-containing protein n=1 Tax=Bordetella hinzii TaxID=103855 RepID=UPI0039FD7E37
MKNIIHLVSVSGGKDSTATLILALKQFPETTFAVFADTGNEHEATLDYLYTLELSLGIRIERIKADFTDRFEHKRDYILTKWPEKGVPVEQCERAASLLQPSGNPYLDLCMLKGRFPSRMAQFCTSELKTLPLTDYALWFIDTLGVDVWSWQGIRRDESAKRVNAKGIEDLTGGIYAFRPIAGWTAQQTVDFVRMHGVPLNPLYSRGMGRVGCMPCINASKAELAEISRRFPEHIERIAEWERVVADVSRRGEASFFPSPDDGRGELRGRNVIAYVQWARTFRGGRVQDPQWNEEAPACASSYGLCE